MNLQVTMRKQNTIGGAIPRLELFEASFQLNRAFGNPYDPDCVRIDAVIAAPDGSIASVPCFWYEGYSRRLTGGQEILTPTGEACWKLRYTPRLIGDYHIYIEVRDMAAEESPRPPGNNTLDFRCVHSPHRGFLRVSALDPAYVEFEDGSPYIGIGHNLCGWEWGGTDNRRGTYEYDEWLLNMANNGATMAQFDFCEGDQLEWTPHPDELPFSADWRGLVYYNAQNAWKMDQRFQRAEELGIYFRLSLLHWEDFDTETEDFPDWGWNRNPYNMANGGPVANVSQFFTSAEARRIYRNHLRYTVARWGYSRNLLAYELWNEVDADDIVWGTEKPDYRSNAEYVADWHREMAAFIKKIDPNKALITTSFAHTYNDDRLWQLPEMDLTTFHRYTYFNGDYDEQQYDTIGALQSVISGRLAVTGKPVLAGEFALSPGGDIQKDYDRQGYEFHDQMWASLMVKGLGTAMHWTWGSYVHDYNLYGHYKPISLFFADEDLRGMTTLDEADTVQWPGGEAAEGAPLHVLGLKSANRALLWIKNTGSGFQTAQRADVPDGAVASVTGIADGRYHAAVFDAWSGQQLAAIDDAVCEQGQLLLSLPGFRHSLAVKLVEASAALPWASADIGAKKINSATQQIGKRFIVHGGGEGIGGARDACRFVHLPIGGNCSLTARVDALTNLGENARAGLMIRNGLSEDAASAFLAMDPRANAHFGCRPHAGETGSSMHVGKPGFYSYIRLTVSEGMLYAAVSEDGRKWLEAAAVAWALPDSGALAGLCVCSKDFLTYVSAEFQDVQFTDKG